jgi:hypothetical protein
MNSRTYQDAAWNRIQTYSSWYMLETQSVTWSVARRLTTERYTHARGLTVCSDRSESRFRVIALLGSVLSILLGLFTGLSLLVTRSGSMPLNFTEAQFLNVLRQGFVVRQSVQAGANDRLRIVVQDQTTGLAGAVWLPLRSR